MAKESKPKLGRGVESLIPDTVDIFSGHEANESGVIYLDPSLLQPNPFQPRKVFNEESLRELADSIEEHGIIQPIVVQKDGDDVFIIAGERRTRAALIAGLKEVPVVYRKFADTKKLEVALIENIQREDLNPIEEAKAYREIMTLSNLNQDETAKRVGKSRSAVANALRLLQLPNVMSSALEVGTITAGHARALLSIADPSGQQLLFNRIVKERLSVREAEMQASEIKQGSTSQTPKSASETETQDSAKKTDEDFELKDIEQQFINALGTKVELKGNFEKGVVHISYFSKEDLDAIYQKLTGN